MQGGVAITGATGLLGTALAASCARDGIPVSALVRDTVRGAERLPSAKLHAWDATRGSPPAAAFEGVDVVVNLMGEPIVDKRWSDARKKQLRDSRVVGTRALVDALRDLPQAPAAADLRVGRRLLRRSRRRAPDGERGARHRLPGRPRARLGGRGDARRRRRAACRRAAQRCWCCRRVRHPAQDPDAVSHGPGRDGRRRRRSGCRGFTWRITSASSGTSMSHEAVSGPLNCVAPEPVTHGEFVRSLGEVLGRPTVLKAPLFALRLRYTSQFVDEVMLASQRVMPVRTLETGYAFRHPLLRGALAEVRRQAPARRSRAPRRPRPSRLARSESALPERSRAALRRTDRAERMRFARPAWGGAAPCAGDRAVRRYGTGAIDRDRRGQRWFRCGARRGVGAAPSARLFPGCGPVAVGGHACGRRPRRGRARCGWLAAARPRAPPWRLARRRWRCGGS